MNALIWLLVFGIAGFATATLFTQDSAGEGWEAFRYFAGLASFLVSGFVWFTLSRGRILGIRRGVAMGALVGLLSHPVTWYLAILYNYFWATRFLQSDKALGPISGMDGSLVFSFWSLLLTGWMTVPVAAGLGAIIAWVLKNTPEQVRNVKRSTGVDYSPTVIPGKQKRPTRE